MPNIFIDPANGQLSIKIKVTTSQNVGYDFRAIDAQQNSIAEVKGNLGLNADQAINSLSAPVSNYINGFLSGVVIIDDDGNDYAVVVSVMQNNVELTPSIQITGASSGSAVTKQPTFHINVKP
jgi:hypothetical protein